VTPTNKPRLLVLSLGGTITMTPSDSGGITPKLGAAQVAEAFAPYQYGPGRGRGLFRG
jgi:L-asparaginase